MTLVTPRWLELDGATNARDLGGLPVDGGGEIAEGVLLRADNLQGLSERDVELLVDEIGVTVVVDLRTGVEVELEGPGPLVQDGRVAIRHRSLYPEVGERTDVAADARPVMPWMVRSGATEDADESPGVRSYLGYLRDRPDSIVAALRDIADAPGAALVHCAAGKDRTGTVIALALTVAGVPREAIVADYVATGEVIGPLLARLTASPTYGVDLKGRPVENYRPRAETLERVFALIDERHGSPEGWLAEHGFGADDAAVLRARLVIS